MSNIHLTQGRGLVGLKFDEDFPIEKFEKDLESFLSNYKGVEVNKSDFMVMIDSSLNYLKLSRVRNVRILRSLLLELATIVDGSGEDAQLSLFYDDDDVGTSLSFEMSKDPDTVGEFSIDPKLIALVNDIIQDSDAKFDIQEHLEYSTSHLEVMDLLPFNKLVKKTYPLKKNVLSELVKRELHEDLLELLGNELCKEGLAGFHQEFILTEKIISVFKEYLTSEGREEELSLIPERLIKLQRANNDLDWIACPNSTLLIRLERDYEYVTFWHLEDVDFTEEINKTVYVLQKNINSIFLKYKFKS